MSIRSIITAAAVGWLACSAALPARAQYYDQDEHWRRREQFEARERAEREQAWRERMWHEQRAPEYYGPPRVFQPPPYWAPAPRGY